MKIEAFRIVSYAVSKQQQGQIMAKAQFISIGDPLRKFGPNLIFEFF